MRARAWAGSLLSVLLLTLALPGGALAHGGNTGPIQMYTQAVGPYELGVLLEMPGATPGTLYIDLYPQGAFDGVTVRLRAAPRGQPFDGRPEAVVNAAPQVAIYYTQLGVDQAGDWDLEVRAEGPQGSGRTLIPFTLVNAPIPGTTLALGGALGLLALLLVASIVLSATAAARRRAVPRWAASLLGYAMFACVVAAAVLGVQQYLQGGNLTAAAAPAAATAPSSGRPHANLTLATTPAAPQAGRPVTLTLDLFDGATGLPVDDLTPHHEALMHLIVLDQTGGFFAHLHPARQAPGRYVIALTPDRPGRYTAYAEIARQESGTQILTGEFQAYGHGEPAAAAAPGPGPRVIDGLTISVAAELGQPRAGQPATLTFSFAAGGQPVTDMQPWLGMAGHLIARRDDGAFFSHIHAAAPMAPLGPAGTGMIYGPDIRFAYTFPQPGRYQLWAQFRHAGRIVTVPLTLDVSA